ncbi:hypothetical protein F5884DRAFT_854039 [Xylogone sp. PMI_703]|nr:hypothetical protein F5884DRAFT_854039 [Xylogone sp. PMI_703]
MEDTPQPMAKSEGRRVPHSQKKAKEEPLEPVSSHSTPNERPKRGRPRLEPSNSNEQSDRRRAQVRAAQKSFHLRNATKVAELKQRVLALEEALSQINALSSSLVHHVVSNDIMEKVPVSSRGILKMALSIQSVYQNTLLRKDNDGQRQGVDSLDRPDDSTSQNSLHDNPSFSSARNVQSPEIIHSAVQQPLEHSLVHENALQLGGEHIIVDEKHDRIMGDLSNTALQPWNELSLSAAWTYSFQEVTFARRLHRACTELCFYLLTSPNASPEQLNQKLGISLKFNTRKQLLDRAQQLLARSTADSLWFDDVPAPHMSQLHYYDEKNLPNIDTRGSEEFKLLQHRAPPGIPLNGDEWYNPYEVEQYLYETGILSSDAPSRPPSIAGSQIGHGVDIFKDGGSSSDYSLSKASWTAGESYSAKFPLSLDSLPTGFPEDIYPTEDKITQEIPLQNEPALNATDLSAYIIQPRVDIDRLADLLIEYSMCLGQSPGFRFTDVQLAIQKASIS